VNDVEIHELQIELGVFEQGCR